MDRLWGGGRHSALGRSTGSDQQQSQSADLPVVASDLVALRRKARDRFLRQVGIFAPKQAGARPRHIKLAPAGVIAPR
jgi:hypothetical protein